MSKLPSKSKVKTYKLETPVKPLKYGSKTGATEGLAHHVSLASTATCAIKMDDERNL